MLSLFKRYMRRYTPFVIATFLFTLANYIVSICFLMPQSKKIIDNGVSKHNTDAIWQSGTMMIVFTFLQSRKAFS